MMKMLSGRPDRGLGGHLRFWEDRYLRAVETAKVETTPTHGFCKSGKEKAPESLRGPSCAIYGAQRPP